MLTSRKQHISVLSMRDTEAGGHWHPLWPSWTEARMLVTPPRGQSPRCSAPVVLVPGRSHCSWSLRYVCM